MLTLHRTADFQEAGPVQAVRQNRRVSYPVWGQTLACYALVVSPLSRRIHSVSLAGSRRFFRRVYSWVHRCYVRCVAGFTRSPLQCCNGVAASPSTVNRIGVSPFPFAFALLKPHTARLAYVVLKCQRTPTRRRLVRSRRPFLKRLPIPCGLAYLPIPVYWVSPSPPGVGRPFRLVFGLTGGRCRVAKIRVCKRTGRCCATALHLFTEYMSERR